METAVATRTWRESRPETVEDDLAALWREAAREAPVARAVMSNLIVFRACHDAPHAAGSPTTDEPLERVVARHPSRVILIEHEAGGSEAGRPIAASVGLAVFGPPGARFAVEQVAVRSACAEVSLPSIVRRLVRGGLPTSLWWTEDLSQVQPVEGLVAMARQLLYDSRHWRDVRRGFAAAGAMARAGEVDMIDLNWRRLQPLRQALVHAARTVRCSVAPDATTIAHRPGDRAVAMLLAGWIASRLGWAPDLWPRIEETRAGDDVLTLTVAASGSTLRADMNGHRVLLKHGASAPLVVGAPRETDADGVAAELKALSYDTALRDALLAISARPGA